MYSMYDRTFVEVTSLAEGEILWFENEVRVLDLVRVEEATFSWQARGKREDTVTLL